MKKSTNIKSTNEDSDSSDGNDIKINEDKRIILPVLNENNVYITAEFLKKTLESGNISIDKIDKAMLDMFQKAFIHKSYVSASYVDEESIKKNEKYYGKIESSNDENKKYIQLQKISFSAE